MSYTRKRWLCTNNMVRMDYPNGAVYDDIDNRRCTAVNFEPLHRWKSLSTRAAAGHQRQEFCSET
jgi:hypothetical protein